MDQIFGFWAVLSLKLSRNTCFCGFKSSLAVNYHIAKPERLTSQKCELQPFVFLNLPV